MIDVQPDISEHKILIQKSFAWRNDSYPIEPSNNLGSQNSSVIHFSLCLKTKKHRKPYTMHRNLNKKQNSLWSTTIIFLLLSDYYFVKRLLNLQAHIHCESTWFNPFANRMPWAVCIQWPFCVTLQTKENFTRKLGDFLKCNKDLTKRRKDEESIVWPTRNHENGTIKAYIWTKRLKRGVLALNL